MATCTRSDVEKLCRSSAYRDVTIDTEGRLRLTPKRLDALGRLLTRRHVPANATLCRQGQAGDEAWLVLDGRVRLRQEHRTPDGRLAVAEREVGAGGFLGEISMLTGLPRMATLCAVTDLTLLVLRREAFSLLLKLQPEVTEATARLMLERTRRQSAELHRAAQSSSSWPLQLPRTLARLFTKPIFRGRPHDGETARLVRLFEESTLLGALAHARPQQVRRIAAACHEIQVSRGTELFRQGDPGDCAYLLVHGVMQGRVKREGREVHSFDSPPDSLIGEMSIFTGAPRSASVVALRDCELVCLPQEAWVVLLGLENAPSPLETGDEPPQDRWPEDPSLGKAKPAGQRETAEQVNLRRSLNAAATGVTDLAAQRRLVRSLRHRLRARAIGAVGHCLRLVASLLDRVRRSPIDPEVKSRLRRVFLAGAFEPVREERTMKDCRVAAGTLPAELRGTLVQNSPAPQFDPESLHHWFDGDGMLHAVDISDGGVSYRNRWVRTEAFLAERAAGKPIWRGLLDFPRLDLPGGILLKNTANTAVVNHGGRLLALCEVGEPYEVQLPRLETVGSWDFEGKLTTNFGAHPKIDPRTGEMYFFSYSVTPPFLHVGVVEADGGLREIQPVRLPRPVMVHDMALSTNWVVLLDCPLRLRPERTLTGRAPLSFEPEYGTRIGLLPRDNLSAEVRWFDIPTCMIFHVFGAREEDNAVVVEGVHLQDPSILFDMPNHMPAEPTHAHRWRLEADGSVGHEPLSRTPIEFPSIAPTKVGATYRYGYASRCHIDTQSNPKPLNRGLVKMDFKDVGEEIYLLPEGHFCGEWCFVPRPGGSEEDDGWLIAFVTEPPSGQSELYVVNARDISAGPVARIALGCRIPIGLHAAWIPHG